MVVAGLIGCFFDVPSGLASIAGYFIGWFCGLAMFKTAGKSRY